VGMGVVVFMLRSATGREDGRDGDGMNDENAKSVYNDDDGGDEERERLSVWNAGWLYAGMLTRRHQEFDCVFMVIMYEAFSRIGFPHRRMRFAFVIELAV